VWRGSGALFFGRSFKWWRRQEATSCSSPHVCWLSSAPASLRLSADSPWLWERSLQACCWPRPSIADRSKWLFNHSRDSCSGCSSSRWVPVSTSRRASPIRLRVAAGFVAVKAITLFPIALLMGLAKRAAGEVAIVLGPGGEFALILIGAAVATNIVSG